MTNTCFLCLDIANNKVCKTCKCYAHAKCWGEYLHDQSRIITLVYDTYCSILSPLSVKCPSCRGKIKNVKPLTRSDTKSGRNFALHVKIEQTVDDLSTTNDIYKKKEMISNLFNILLNNITLHSDNPSYKLRIHM